MPSRLKSLELQGYKTFANRTVFEYAGTITAIVGPNGSGKSNIADSIRWVLGEQSYSILRGKKTEDMIFSGSEQRPRAGMASATMVFDNSDGWLPIDFSEVAVTRRAYRDGQNEYLINGSRVRLKDVSELLAQSGLAERTYTVIGQGLVDAALALKAEERRRLFEEAAGIGLYRSRREEALRRLDSTRRNLERAQDILAELTPRLKSLERQARRAEEYEQMRSDLRVLMREWYGFHWHRAQVELAESKKLTQVRLEALDREREAQVRIDEQLSSLRTRIQTLRSELNSRHHQLAQLHARREEVSRERVAVDERARWQKQQEQSSREEIARLGEELELQREMADLANGEVTKLEDEMRSAQSEYQLAQAALETRLAERKRIEAELKVAQSRLQQVGDRKAELSARQVQSQAQIERLQANLASLAGGLASLDGEIAQVQEAVEGASRQVGEAESAQKALEARLATQRQRIQRLETNRQEVEKKRAEILAEISRLATSMDVLQQAESTLSGYAEGARLVLQAAQKKSLSGVLGAVSQVLDVPGEYETAIASILGEYLDAIVLEKGGDPDRALDLLIEKTSRGVLLPLASVKARPLAGAPRDVPGCLGLAAELVEARGEFQPIVDLLLGRVVVVENRAAARRLLARAGDDLQVVTLNGEIFHSSGAIQAGREGHASRLNRRKQMATLQAGLDKAQSQAEALDRELESLQDDLLASEKEAAELQSAMQDNRSRIEALWTAQRQSQLEVDKAQNMRRLQVEQKTQLEVESGRLHDVLAQASAELEALESEANAAQQDVQALNAQLSADTLQEFHAQVNHWNATLMVLQRASGDARSRLSERQAAYQKTSELLAGAQSHLEEAQAACRELEARMVVLKNAEAEVSQEIAQLNQAIAPAEEALRGVENELLDFQEKEVAVRGQISAAEGLATQARIGQTRQQERLEALQRRIEDDFGLVAFEYSEEVSGRTPLPLSGLVERLPRVENISGELESMIAQAKATLRRMGAINMEAKAEYEEVRQRHAFMTEQISDLEKAEQDIRQVIAELDEIMQQEFRRTFEAVEEEFKTIFTQLFGGGSARLILTDPEDLTGTGIDIEARLPGKRLQGLSLLSGGERSLTATALIFALLRVSPTPFCVLDEVDAMLDEANVGRFSELLRELSQKTQFIIVTHNRNTVQVADVLYGVTMGRDSTSQVISLKLDDLDKVLRN